MFVQRDRANFEYDSRFSVLSFVTS